MHFKSGGMTIEVIIIHFLEPPNFDLWKFLLNPTLWELRSNCFIYFLMENKKISMILLPNSQFV